MLVSKIDLHLACIQTVELRYIGDHSEQQKILLAHHVDATGHMGEEKDLARISERFVWAGVVKALKQKGQTIYYVCMYFGLARNLCHNNTAIRLSKHQLAQN